MALLRQARASGLFARWWQESDGAERVSLQISPSVGEKAIRLVEQGRVTLHDMTSATVHGDHGVYEVRAHKGGGFTCTCMARGARCSHVAAASLAWAEAIQATA
jgi:hypothetical protein